MIEKTVTVKWVGKKQKKDKSGEYDAVTLVDAKGKESTFGIFSDKNFYVEGAVLNVKIEKNEAGYWNIQGVERVKEILKEEAFRELQEQVSDLPQDEMFTNRRCALIKATDYTLARIQAGEALTYGDVINTATIFVSFLDSGTTAKKED